MLKPRFQIRIIGSGVSPETVSASDLAGLLVELEKAVLAAGDRQNESQVGEAILSLVNVAEGSNQLTLAVAQTGVSALMAVSHAVASGDYRNLPVPCHEALHRISGQAARHEWVIELVPNPGLDIAPGTISHDHEVPPPPSPALATGTTVVFGRCLRVGGAGQPRAEIRLPEGHLLHIDVSEDLAKVLAHRLYEEVCIEGRATWRTNDWSLVEFRGAHVSEYRPTRLVDAFSQMAAEAGERWDGVDANAHVRELRSEDAP
jgi:hypothetical protein